MFDSNEEKSKCADKLCDIFLGEGDFREELRNLVMTCTASNDADDIRQMWELYISVMNKIACVGLDSAYCLSYLPSDRQLITYANFFDKGYGRALLRLMRGVEFMYGVMAGRKNTAVHQADNKTDGRANEPYWLGEQAIVKRYADAFEDSLTTQYVSPEQRKPLQLAYVMESIDNIFNYVYENVRRKTLVPKVIVHQDEEKKKVKKSFFSKIAEFFK